MSVERDEGLFGCEPVGSVSDDQLRGNLQYFAVDEVYTPSTIRFL